MGGARIIEQLLLLLLSVRVRAAAVMRHAMHAVHGPVHTQTRPGLGAQPTGTHHIRVSSRVHVLVRPHPAIAVLSHRHLHLQLLMVVRLRLRSG